MSEIRIEVPNVVLVPLTRAQCAALDQACVHRLSALQSAAGQVNAARALRSAAALESAELEATMELLSYARWALGERARTLTVKA